MAEPGSAPPPAVLEVEPEPKVPAAPAEHHDWRAREVGLAVRNALKLGGSLILTWGMGLVARLYVPRFLGPDKFGILNFADAFTAASFVVLGLGIDTYVRKEISVRPEHANDFVGGVVALRFAMLVIIYAGMELVLRATHRSMEVRYLVYIYGIGQFMSAGNTTSAGLLHAVGRVNEMSVLNVVAKIVWSLGIALGLILKLGPWVFATAFAVSEALKSGILFRLAQKHVGFKVRLNARATWTVLLASLPFYVSAIAATITNRIDVSILAVTSTDREVGWYGAAGGLAGLIMFLTPLISWVLIPLFARAGAASEEELCQMIRRSLEFIMTLTIPVTLMMVVGADFGIGIVFGPKFAPAAAALQVLAVAYLLMYVSLICWCALTVLKMTWPVTAVIGFGTLINPPLNVLLIKRGLHFFGDGGGGVACATSTLLTEIVIVSLLLRMLGRRGMDARLVGSMLKSIAAAALVVALDRFVLRAIGPLRLVLDAVLYAALVLVTRAADVRGMVGWVQMAMKQRKQARAA